MEEYKIPDNIIQYCYLIDSRTLQIEGILILNNNFKINRNQWEIVDRDISISELEDVLEKAFGINDRGEVNNFVSQFAALEAHEFYLIKIIRRFRGSQKSIIVCQYHDESYLALSSWPDSKQKRKYWALLKAKIDPVRDASDLWRIGFTRHRSLSTLQFFVKTWNEVIDCHKNKISIPYIKGWIV